VKQLNPDELRSWLDDRARQQLFSGVVTVREGPETTFEHAAGLAHRGHRVPLTVHTRFQVASVTKMITAATALRLVERGALSLSRPVTGSLPPELRPSALDDRHTLHHLLSHTSGLPNYHDDEDESWDSFTDALDRVPAYKARGPADILPLFADLPAVADPGEFIYGDANFILIGILIEWVTGRSFAQVATEEVLTPAGMSNSGFIDLDLEPDGLASSYLVSDDPPETWRSNIYSVPAGGMPDGGLITTAPDLARFLDAMRSGEVITPETHSLMLTPHGVDPDSPEGYGYGMELVVKDGTVGIYGHAGADPGVSAMVSHYVASGTTVIVLCNQDRGSWAVAQRIAEELGLDDPRE
jgi:CubicO group peptidase (beta-lactamase class C family)